MNTPSLIRYNMTANGQSPGVIWRGGRGEFDVRGDIGGGDVALQQSLDGGATWEDMDAANLTTDAAPFSAGFERGPRLLRVNLTGSTDPDLFVTVQRTSA